MPVICLTIMALVSRQRSPSMTTPTVTFWPVFGKCLVRISISTPRVLIGEVFCNFSQILHAATEIGDLS